MRLLRRLRAYLRVLPKARRNRGDFLRYLVRRPALFAAIGAYEGAVLVSNRVDPRLKYLATMKTASMVGCEFCMDLGSPVTRSLGVDAETMADLPRYSESERFTPVEKLVLDYTVAMTRTPAVVEEDLRARLLKEFTSGQLAELASIVAWENHRSRMNQGLGVRPVGFAEGDFCVVAEDSAPAPPRKRAVA